MFWFLAYIYLTVPDVRPLARQNPTETAFMQRREAEARRQQGTVRRVHRWTPYGRISENLKRAVLVAEDSAFWQHEGVDFEQIRESMEVNLERREFARGASTITQQLAKNLYLSPSRNPVRKLRELFIARRLEAVLTKRRILELYLNVIEWGDGVWGAEAAARTYFGRSAASLGAEHAALLAGAIINPRVLDPGHPTPRLRRRQALVLRRMRRVTPPQDPVTVVAPVVPGPPAIVTPDPAAPPAEAMPSLASPENETTTPAEPESAAPDPPTPPTKSG
jgi:monofunctional biosynthetic peptidoglycan transglycosylase